MFCAVTKESHLEGLSVGTVVVDNHGVLHQRHTSGWWSACGVGLSNTPEVAFPALILAHGIDLYRELEKLNVQSNSLR